MSEAVRLSGIEVDAAEPAIATGSDGTIYVVWVEHAADGGADLAFRRFDLKGKPIGSALRINPQIGAATAWQGDPPTVGVGPDGAIYVGWTARVPAQLHAADLYLSVSRDHGKSFELPVMVNDDQKPGPHGMHSLAIAADGTVYVAWLDERNLQPVTADHRKTTHKHSEQNREFFLAHSKDGGKTFSQNRRIGTDVCPCCKTSLAIARDGRLYASWRQVQPGNLRHIAVASSSDEGQTFTPPVIVSDDRWILAGCPVSGSSLYVSTDGTLHVLWYSAGEAGPSGNYVSESHDGGRSFKPRQLIAEGLAQGTPVLLPYSNGSRAVWQSDQGSEAHVATAHFDTKGIITTSYSTEANGELPAASSSDDQILLAYVRQANDNRRSVWLLRRLASN
ncbi:MAG: sialidase family protein [Pyrinomonadaceae bacterium]